MTAMTISDTERREVAARLRALDYNDLQESLICAYLDALGIKGYEDWIGIAHHLADLIEPSCDREALLDMEDEMFESATGIALISELEEDADLKDLQTTMAKVLFGYARRIREACGEVVR